MQTVNRIKWKTINKNVDEIRLFVDGIRNRKRSDIIIEDSVERKRTAGRRDYIIIINSYIYILYRRDKNDTGIKYFKGLK